MYTIGQTVQKRYRICSIRGQGGSGIVYKVEDLRFGSKLRALKLIKRQESGEGSCSWDQQVYATVTHRVFPEAVDYFVDEAESSEIVVMEWIDGLTLQERLAEKPAISELELQDWNKQLLNVLIDFHSMKPALVYRDLKPENVMIQRDGQLRLVDVGIARWYEPHKSTDTVKLGTSGFTAPEALRGEQTDAQSDLYALGVMLYYLWCNGCKQTLLQLQKRQELAIDTALCQADLIPLGWRIYLEKLAAISRSNRFKNALEAMSLFEKKVLQATSEPRLVKRGLKRSTHIVERTVPIWGFYNLYASSGASTLVELTSAWISAKAKYHIILAWGPAANDWLYRLRGWKWKERQQNGIVCFQTGHSIWILDITEEAQPSPEHLLWQAEQIVSTSGFSRADRILIDFGTYSADSDNLWLLQCAQAWFVADPCYWKWARADIQKRKWEIDRIRSDGHRLRFVINRCSDIRGIENRWLACWPDERSCDLVVLPLAATLFGELSRCDYVEVLKNELQAWNQELKRANVISSKVLA